MYYGTIIIIIIIIIIITIDEALILLKCVRKTVQSDTWAI